MKTKNDYDEKGFDSVTYLKNVLSWDDFCKQHGRFEEALKDVLEENERLKVKQKHQTEPKNLKLELIRELVDDGRTRQIYQIGRYTVGVDTTPRGGKYITIELEKDRYLPYISVNNNLKGEIFGFKVETTSYGSLPSEEISRVIDGLKEAQEVVEILEDAFLHKEE